MKRTSRFILAGIGIFLSIAFIAIKFKQNPIESKILSYEVDLKKQDLQLYWKNDAGEIIGSLGNLKTYVESKNRILLFAMNGGMYLRDQRPQGLFIQNFETYTLIDTSSGNGNFYLKPNGVFYITDKNTPIICMSTNFIERETIKFATQSGPMLVIDGQIHPEFKEGSTNVNIRNGVGILPNNKVIFAITKEPINLFDFATYFQSIGCKNALYLDGYVSRMYLPQKNWIQTDGNFGVMIGVTK
ncbi:MAG: hypothetical protein CFE21_07295 [Bacteroidetes bacterium B1(2017)]|nr:MAG: hypothetical protein CFE21_07295 [Bacteroidetes bacterium B1(2017)]